MAKNIWPDDFCCPKCKKTPAYNAVIGDRKYLARRLDLPYFLCGDCRICSYSKELIKQTIRRWKESVVVPDRQIYRESTEALDKVLQYLIKTAGYRLGRFQRK